MSLEHFESIDNETIDNYITKRDFLKNPINKEQFWTTLIKISKSSSWKIITIIELVMPTFNIKEL